MRVSCLYPYCAGELTAKKGQRLGHHFAHSQETCREVNRDGREIPHLPLYDKFNIWLTGRELQQLKNLWNRYGTQAQGIDKNEVPSVFIREKLLELDRYKGGYQFTKLGKIPVGALSLNLFNQVQEPIALERLEKYENKTQEAYLKNLPNLNQYLRDLQIYRADLHKILSNSLYYLKIDIDNQSQNLYKIGVTQRDIELRITEIKQELKKHFESVSIKVLGIWEHRGNVGKYFKYRYAKFNFPIAKLTEYYAFTEQEAKAVLSDLRRMKPKILSLIEADILARKPSGVEQLIKEQEQTHKRSQAIKTGMERAKNWGQQVGRPPVTESTEEFLAKPSSQRVIAALEQGLSLRKAAEQAGVAINTVRKVKALMTGLIYS